MEVTSVQGVAGGVQPILCGPSSPISSLSILFPTPWRSARAKNSHLCCATTRVAEAPNNGSNRLPKRHSKHYLARQSAIVQVQDSSDLGSALTGLGGSLTVQDLNAIIRHLGTKKRWHDLSQLFEWMLQNEKVSASSYSSYVKFMGKSLNPVKALEIYNNIQDESTKKNVHICNSVLGSLIRSGKFDVSFKLFDQMKQNGLTPDAVTYSTSIADCSALRKEFFLVERSGEVLRWKFSGFNELEAIQGFFENVLGKEMEHLWDRLLAGCSKLKNGYNKALEFVQELQRNELQMDSVIYGTLLAVCASNNKLEEAEGYFKKMKDEGHSPNVYHYSSLLNAHSMRGNYKEADALVQDMKSAGLVPNKVILTTLLKVYVRGGLFEKSRELLGELEALGYAEDEMPYCLLMDALAKAGRIHEAKLVFQEMKEKSVQSDGYSYSIMISAFCRGGLLEDAKQLAKDFEGTHDRYDLVMLNTMICAYCRAGNMDSVMEMMRKMDELKITPDYNTFHILIKYFCKEKLYLLAYQTMEDMHNKGHQPDEVLCSSLMFLLGKIRAYSEAYSVYNMLRYSTRTMCKALHEKILHILVAGQLLRDAYVVVKDNAGLISKPAIKKFATAYMKLGNINLINDVLKAVDASGCKIDQGLFQMAICRYVSLPEKKDMLFQMLQWMPGQGYVADSATRNLILKNSRLFGHQQIAEILSKQHMISKASKSREKEKRV